MSPRKLALLRRTLLGTVIAFAVWGICGCGQVKNGQKPNWRARKAELAYRAKLLAKVKNGWDGDIAAAKRPKRTARRR